MKVRAVLKSLLFSYALTGVALLLLAFLLFTFDLGETADRREPSGSRAELYYFQRLCRNVYHCPEAGMEIK